MANQSDVLATIVSNLHQEIQHKKPRGQVKAFSIMYIFFLQLKKSIFRRLSSNWMVKCELVFYQSHLRIQMYLNVSRTYMAFVL